MSRRKSEDGEAPKIAHPNDWGPRAFEITGFGAYRLTVTRAGIVFDVSRLRREREELVGELVVRCDFAGARTIDGILSAGDFNLSSIQARGTRAKHLASRAITDDVDWEGYLSELSLKVIGAERQGMPASLFQDIAPNPDAGEYDILGVTLPKRAPMILFGDGGSAKSLFALYSAGELAKRGEIVLYADWESSGADHRDRLDLIYPHGLPAVLYVRCERPLTVEADRLRTIAGEHGVTYAVLDSAAYGCHGAPETADAAIGYFRSLRSLGPIGSLVIAHVTKAEDGDKRPFGSGFFHNSARATWHVKRSNPDEDGTDVHVLFSQRKCNAGRLRSPHAVTVSFQTNAITFARSSAADVQEFASGLSLLQRIRGVLRPNALTLEQLSAELPDQRPDTLTRTVRRGCDRGILVRFQSADGRELIGLKATGS